ncbi:hypothetical protein VNO77_01669 [Canavalia gladiata]|uniref:Uncharacterized protein n=1 Tax=Canavalia gladiata TaxID=3824 RepID=A0AAN9R5F6_CANGL
MMFLVAVERMRELPLRKKEIKRDAAVKKLPEQSFGKLENGPNSIGLCWKTKGHHRKTPQIRWIGCKTMGLLRKMSDSGRNRVIRKQEGLSKKKRDDQRRKRVLCISSNHVLQRTK